VRILHISAQYHPILGGAQHQIKQISDRLARRGHDVTVFTQNEGEPGACLPDSERINLVNVKRFKPNHLIFKLIKQSFRVRGGYRLLNGLLGTDLLQILAEAPLNVQLATHALTFNADIVAVINWATSLAYQVYLARRMKRFRFVGIPLFHTEETWTRSVLYSKMLTYCDAVMVNTEHEKHFAKTRAPGQDSIYVVGVGVDPDEFLHRDGQSVRNRYGIGDAPIVGYVGRIAPNKGVIRLLEAMKIVWKFNVRVHLILAGARLFGDKRADQEVAAALNRLSAAEKARVIHIDGFNASEKASIFDSFDVFAMPSVGESFGIAYLEAWMCRKPVIGSRIGSTQCVVQDRKDGLLVNPTDAEEIAMAIMNLLSDPGKSKAMGEQGYCKTVSQFTWEKVTDEVERIYLTLAKPQRERIEGKEAVPRNRNTGEIL
jgi:glycosyltransferase involved in cell wall biosynthesis